MARSRSRSRSRSRERRRRRSRSRSKERRRRSRTRSRERRRDSDRHDRDRDRDRCDRDRDRDRDRGRRSRDSRSRSRSRDRGSRREDEERRPSTSAPPVPAAPESAAAAAAAPPPPAGGEAAERRARLEAWKARQQQAAGAAPAPPADRDGGPNGSSSGGGYGGLGFRRAASPDEEPDDAAPSGLGYATSAPRASSGLGFVPAGAAPAASATAASAAAAAAAYVAAAAAAPRPAPGADGGDDDVDPLDAFMAQEILPEVAQKQAEEAAKKEAERLKHAELLAAGKAPKKLDFLEDSDSEGEPDLVIKIPTSRVKLLVGAGGLTIGTIQRKSKARVQIQKDEEELNRAWGSGPSQPVKLPPALRQQMQKQQAMAAKAAKEGRMLQAAAQPKPAVILGGPSGAEGDQAPEEHEAAAAAAAAKEKAKEKEKEAGKEKEGEADEASSDEEKPGAPPRKMTTVLIFGDQKAVEIAERMIHEAIDNKEQKAKQRQKEYAKKRDEKSRARLLYHMRHTKNYEALELTPGASKTEVKKAYRRLAMLWHPDKHPEDPETAKAKFQVIQKAYDALMSTDEEEIQAQIAN